MRLRPQRFLSAVQWWDGCKIDLPAMSPSISNSVKANATMPTIAAHSLSPNSHCPSNLPLGILALVRVRLARFLSMPAWAKVIAGINPSILAFPPCSSPFALVITSPSRLRLPPPFPQYLHHGPGLLEFEIVRFKLEPSLALWEGLGLTRWGGNRRGLGRGYSLIPSPPLCVIRRRRGSSDPTQ